MIKRVRLLIIVLLLSIVSITNSFFNVKADNNGEFYYAPNDSISAYNFFMGIGLTFDRYKFMGVNSIYSPSHNITEQQHTITHNYRSLWNGVPQSTGSYETQFLNSDRQIVSPVDTVSSHNMTVNSYYMSSDDYLNSYYTLPSLTGTINNNTGYNTSSRFQVYGNDTTIFSWIGTRQTANTVFHVSTGNSSDITVGAAAQISFGDKNLYKYVYTIKNNTTTSLYVSPQFFFESSSVEIVPLFLGARRFATDDIVQSMGLNTDTEIKLDTCIDLLEDINSSLIIVNQHLVTIEGKIDLTNSKLDTANNHLTEIENVLIRGNTISQNKVNSNNNKTTNLNTTENQYHNIETTHLNNFQTNLDNISTTNNLYTNNGFLESAWFIRAVFNRLINYDPSGALKLMISFSLVLGIALTIIGKLRN